MDEFLFHANAARALALQSVRHCQQIAVKPLLLAVLEDGVGIVNEDEIQPVCGGLRTARGAESLSILESNHCKTAHAKVEILNR